MPLEISEIGIRLSVGEPAAASPAAPVSDGAAPTGLAPHEIDELVRRCVAEVLDTLRMLGDR
jgi:hypothetical protein